MKYGRFVYGYTGEYHAGTEALYNIGDNIQTIATDNLYCRCGIKKEDIVDFNFTDLCYEDCCDLVPFLKKWEPILDRDKATLFNLQKNVVQSYLSERLTITLPKRDKEPKDGRIFQKTD